MSLIELFIIAVGLSMDAFAVSICKGLSMRTMSLKNAVIVGLYFGGFQGLMPLIGYFLGIHFQQAITSYDHWIAFILLGIIGISMIREALSGEEESCNASLAIGDMLVLAVATCIDAPGRWRYLCISSGRNSSGYLLYRMYYISPVWNRCKSRNRFRMPI